MNNQDTYQIKILSSAFNIYGGFENLYPLLCENVRMYSDLGNHKDLDTFFDKRYTTFEINNLIDWKIMSIILGEIDYAILNSDEFEPYPTVSSWNRLIKQTAENLKEYEKELKEIRKSI